MREITFEIYHGLYGDEKYQEATWIILRSNSMVYACEFPNLIWAQVGVRDQTVSFLPYAQEWDCRDDDNSYLWMVSVDVYYRDCYSFR